LLKSIYNYKLIVIIDRLNRSVSLFRSVLTILLLVTFLKRSQNLFLARLLCVLEMKAGWLLYSVHSFHGPR